MSCTINAPDAVPSVVAMGDSALWVVGKKSKIRRPNPRSITLLFRDMGREVFQRSRHIPAVELHTILAARRRLIY